MFMSNTTTRSTQAAADAAADASTGTEGGDRPEPGFVMRLEGRLLDVRLAPDFPGVPMTERPVLPSMRVGHPARCRGASPPAPCARSLTSSSRMTMNTERQPTSRQVSEAQVHLLRPVDHRRAPARHLPDADQHDRGAFHVTLPTQARSDSYS
jgi:hypothetical protein